MTTAPRRLVTPERRDEDADASLRPQRLSEFVGQAQARANLSVFIEAARARKEALDHVLFVGPPGLGKTTLAQIVARELGVNFRATSGPVIAKAGDLAALLTNLEERDVLFIDEIHRLNPAVEEILYPAMEDYQLDLIIGEGPAARSVKIDLAKFTLVGATTRAGLLTTPLRDRFGIPVRLNFYTREELEQIVNRGARVLGVALTADGADEIARRARGTPRIAGRLLKRVRDFAHVDGAKAIDRKVADKALGALEVDAAGLDAMDRRYLTTIALNYGGGPVGVETIAAALSEPRDAIEEIIEPFLIQQGFLQRTPRGRLLTGHAFRHLGLAEPARDPGAVRVVQSGGRGMSAPIRIVAALIRDEQGRVLLVRKRGTAAFMQPGGKRDPGEDDVTALARELDEELGCRVVPETFAALGTFECVAANEPDRRVNAAVYRVDVTGAIAARAEIDEIVWIDPVSPPDIHLAPLTRDHVLPLARSAPGESYGLL